MKILKRILLFLVCFVVIAFAISFLGGALAGMVAAREMADPAAASEAGRTAGIAFGMRYGLLIYAVSVLGAAMIAFRWYVTMVLIVAGVAFCFLEGYRPDLQALLQWQAPGRTGTESPRGFVTGSRVRLREPVMVSFPYGKISMPAGTEAQVIAATADAVQLRIQTGQEVTVPKAKVR